MYSWAILNLCISILSFAISFRSMVEASPYHDQGRWPPHSPRAESSRCRLSAAQSRRHALGTARSLWSQSPDLIRSGCRARERTFGPGRQQECTYSICRPRRRSPPPPRPPLRHHPNLPKPNPRHPRLASIRAKLLLSRPRHP